MTDYMYTVIRLLSHLDLHRQYYWQTEWLIVQNFGKSGWPDGRFLVSVSLTKIPSWRNFKLIRFVRVLRGKIITWRILVSELLTKNWITIRFIFSSSDVDWHLDQPIKRKKIVAHKIRENPIVASFYHFLTASWATKKPHQPTTWRSSGVLVSGGGRAKDMIDMKIEEDEDKRMRSWKTKRRSRRSTWTLSRRFSMAILYKQPRKRR